jgi:hypothetical protein
MPKRKTLDIDELNKTVDEAGGMPEAENYGSYKSGGSMYRTSSSMNYGAHTMQFEFLGIRFWFSYSTLVAFQFPMEPAVVIRNYWGPTTSRHLNWIYSKIRGSKITEVSEEEFRVRYLAGLREMGLTTVPALCIFNEEAKSPKRKPRRLVGIKKKDEPLVAEPLPVVKKSDFVNHPKKLTRLEKLAWDASNDIQEYNEQATTGQIEDVLV